MSNARELRGNVVSTNDGTLAQQRPCHGTAFSDVPNTDKNPEHEPRTSSHPEPEGACHRGTSHKTAFHDELSPDRKTNAGTPVTTTGYRTHELGDKETQHGNKQSQPGWDADSDPSNPGDIWSDAHETVDDQTYPSPGGDLANCHE